MSVKLTIARGAKTAMSLALKSPNVVESLISVDNAPVDASLKSDFVRYTQAMRRIEDANLNKQADADAILSEYEEVGILPLLSLESDLDRIFSRSLYASSSSQILYAIVRPGL